MKILLCGALDKQFERLIETFPEITFESSDNYDFVTGSVDADAVIAFSRDALDKIFSTEMIENCSSLKWVHAPGAGIDTYMSRGLAKAGFLFTCGKIIQGVEVADHAVALLLMLTRSLSYALKGLSPQNFPRPVELRGKTAVIIGAGGIGLCVAERLSAFGMTVHTVAEDNFPLVSYVDQRFLSDQLLDALPLADAVIVAAPWTAKSEEMLGKQALLAMKKEAFLVNVARGGLISTEDLAEVIENGHLKAVALDVTNPEPLPEDHRLRQRENIVLTPHLAGISDNLSERIFDLITTNIRRFSNNQTLINLVDTSKGY